MADTLATWLVEMDASSVRALSGLLDQVNEQAEAAAKALKDAGDEGKDAGDKGKAAAKDQLGMWEKLGGSVKGAAGQLVAFAASATGASAGLAGIMFAGLRGTAEMERLLFNFQQISREIANIFAPAIRAVVSVTNTLLAAFRDLTGDQQATIRNFVAAASGAALFAAAAGSIIPKIAGIGAAVSGLWAVMAANPVTAIVGAIGAMLAGTEQGRDALGEMFDAVKPIFEAIGEVASVVAEVLGPALTAVAEIVKGVLVPVFVLLKPVFELIATVIRGIAGAVSALARFFGLARSDRERARPRDELNNASKGLESFEQTWRSLQQAIARQDVPREHLREARTQTSLLQALVGRGTVRIAAAVAA
jgi:phage-related protein